MLKHLEAAYPLLFVETPEEYRLLRWLCDVLPNQRIVHFSLATGLVETRTGRVLIDRPEMRAIWSKAVSEALYMVVFDFHQVCQGAAGYRPLLDALGGIERVGSRIIAVAPSWSRINDELRRYGPVLDWDLPGKDQLREDATVILESAGLTTEKADEMAQEALGLTVSEARNAFALAIVENGRKQADPMVVRRERLRMIRSIVGLEVAHPASIEDVGGLGALKRWVNEELVPSIGDPEIRVRNALLVGPPGTGKSLACRAIASRLNYPLVRLDLAACRGMYVGQSEANIRNALRTIRALGQVVVWMDEIDSATAGHESSAETEGGVTLSMVSTLLTWMQEDIGDALVLATANYPWRIPPAMTRPGRMDAIWAIDLPDELERQEIAAIHLRRLRMDVKLSRPVAEATAGYSGAEVMAVVTTLARRTQRGKTMSAASIRQCAETITPLSESRRDELNKMRQWANAYARSASDRTPAAQELRRML